MNDFKTNFDPQEYLESRWQTPGETEFRCFPYKILHEFFAEKKRALEPGAEYKVLDYGSGPVVAYVVSAATVATEIVFADISDKNRKAIQRWVDREESAWNWSPHIAYIIENIEGKSAEEAVERERQLRKVIRGVVPCDVMSQEQLICKGYEGPYDAVYCFNVLAGAATTVEEYKAAIKRVSSLIKKGGSLLLYAQVLNDTSKPGCYPVGSARFSTLPTTLNFILATAKEAGIGNVTTKICKKIDPPIIMDEAAFIIGTKI